MDGFAGCLCHCFGRVTLWPQRHGKNLKKATNIKREIDGFVEKVESSRNVHPMALSWSSCTEGGSFHVAEGRVSTRPLWDTTYSRDNTPSSLKSTSRNKLVSQIKQVEI